MEKCREGGHQWVPPHLLSGEIILKAERWLALSNKDKLDRLLLLGGVKLQTTVKTVPKQTTNHTN